MNPPTAQASAPRRRWRASILAVVVVYVAVLGHLTGGGMAPGPSVVAVAFGLSWPVCWQLSTVGRGFPAILAVLTLAQPVLHVVLEFGGALFAGAAGHSAEHHPAAVIADSQGAAPHAAAGAGATVMLSFHAVAALVSAVVLARGERALTGVLSAGRRVAGWVVSAVTALAGAPAPVVAAPARPDDRSLPSPWSIALPERHGRRGPPQVLGAY
ncbi:MAG: hypothetical protein WKF57_17520 [Nakamurella sp.]